VKSGEQKSCLGAFWKKEKPSLNMKNKSSGDTEEFREEDPAFYDKGFLPQIRVGTTEESEGTLLYTRKEKKKRSGKTSPKLQRQ